MKRKIVLLIAVVLSLTYISCSSDEDEFVEIYFEQKEVTIKVGEEIRLTVENTKDLTRLPVQIDNYNEDIVEYYYTDNESQSQNSFKVKGLKVGSAKIRASLSHSLGSIEDQRIAEILIRVIE